MCWRNRGEHKPGNLLGQQALDPVQLGHFVRRPSSTGSRSFYRPARHEAIRTLCQAPNGAPEISVINGRRQCGAVDSTPALGFEKSSVSHCSTLYIAMRLWQVI